ncbi:hypothetical protein [Pseudomonas gingeri]|uniref:Uncharacterized protein n=1 Tax=Pseudomonas gingeri TaxID=117681 RepID=A0A7Y8BK26_9PSED|nr:hypothetical protein [Pseudomonas gingeri]NWB46604.1 hypothetical protein [Pseudomonas gingeri]
MRLCFFDGLDRIEIADRAGFAHDPFDTRTGNRTYDQRAVKMDLGETWQVERFVRRYFQRAGEMHRLRSLLSSQLAHNHRLPDAEVLRQFSRNLQNGQLCAYVYPYVPMVRTRVPTSEAAGRVDTPAARPMVRRPAKKPSVETDTPPPVQVESEQQKNTKVVQDNQAATLVAAAKSATPFCEICERNKAAAGATE